MINQYIFKFSEKCGIGAFLETSRSSSKCVLCPKDTYTDTIGQPICKVCPPGTGTLNMGTTSADDCKGKEQNIFSIY